MNLSVQQIQKHEHGETNISSFRLIKIAEVLDTSIIDFMNVVSEYSGNATAGLSSKQFVLYNSKDIEIFKKIHRLTKGQKKALTTLLEC